MVEKRFTLPELARDFDTRGPRVLHLLRFTLPELARDYEVYSRNQCLLNRFTLPHAWVALVYEVRADGAAAKLMATLWLAGPLSVTSDRAWPWCVHQAGGVPGC